MRGFVFAGTATASNTGGGSAVVGAGITTVGIVLLVVGLVGASIEVYVQVQSAIVQQQLSAILEQLPSVLRPALGGDLAGGAEPPSDSTEILWSLLQTVIANPLWLTLTVAGILLIYLGLFVSNQHRARR
jgi:uncharacterized membrane protein